MRLDQYLVHKKEAPSRSKAKELITKGQVRVRSGSGDERVITTPAFEINEDLQLVVTVDGGETLKYVSRAGLKLEAALCEFKVPTKGLEVLDVGQSTGGFTDALLQAGAIKVTGVDVGAGQLHETIESDPRVQAFEKVNARELSQFAGLQTSLGKFNAAVIDVSFISVLKVLPEVVKFLRSQAWVIALVKPQFEVGREHLNKGGVVNDEQLREKSVQRVVEWFDHNGLSKVRQMTCPLKGQDGNQEYLVVGILDV